jgi:rRNA pseudouridine-1189 N-methylase Emg1 (Nep1/Mra1 family)
MILLSLERITLHCISLEEKEDDEHVQVKIKQTSSQIGLDIIFIVLRCVLDDFLSLEARYIVYISIREKKNVAWASF